MGKPESYTHASSRLAHRTFASYAREDISIVEAVASVIESLGFGEVRWDLRVLHAGVDWRKHIFLEIESADSFQLFWSERAKRSRPVRSKWKHALQLGRSGFIKAVYWQDPIARPPRELSALHFSRITLVEKETR